MKKLVLVVFMMFVCVASATTVDLNWLVDNGFYAQTTCENGGDLILPSAPSPKYGYTFRGWKLAPEIITGTGAQNEHPSPSNPVYPTFYESNGMILRAIGDIADIYDGNTGIIIRRIGVKVLNGSEGWGYSPYDDAFYLVREDQVVNSAYLCSHFKRVSAIDGNYQIRGGNGWSPIIRYSEMNGYVSNFKQWLAEQYAAGTPVTIYYVLRESVQEVWTWQ